MKNIHIIPTDKPTWLHKSLLSGVLRKSSNCINDMKQAQGMNMYITNDEEIKEGDYYISILENEVYKATKETQNIMSVANLIGTTSYKKTHFKIILTTDEDLIKDGVKSIDDEFLNWFSKNSDCEYVEVEREKSIGYTEDRARVFYGKLKIIIPKEEPKQETLEEAAELALVFHNTYEKLAPSFGYETRQDTKEFDFKSNNGRLMVAVCSEVIKWQQEQDKKMYSEEDLREAFRQGQDNMDYSDTYGWDSKLTEQDWFEQFKNK